MAEQVKENMGAFLRRLAETPAATANSEVLEKLQAKFVAEEASKLEARLTRVKSLMDQNVAEMTHLRRQVAKNKKVIEGLEELANKLVAGDPEVSENFEVSFDKARY